MVFGCEHYPIVQVLKACVNEKSLMTKHHQTLFGDQTFYRLDTLFDALWSCLMVVDKIWRPSNHSIKNLNHSFVLVFDGRCFVRLNRRVSNMFYAGMRTKLAQQLVLIVWSVFDQTCFNRLATHLNLQQHVWSSNNVWWCLVAKHFPFVQAVRFHGKWIWPWKYRDEIFQTRRAL